uniref:Integral membrane protein n=1 Tax=Parastrongyloides trichosuri TaxID=131310 RepID=A0A0N5A081_PARTI
MGSPPGAVPQPIGDDRHARARQLPPANYTRPALRRGHDRLGAAASRADLCGCSVVDHRPDQRWLSGGALAPIPGRRGVEADAGVAAVPGGEFHHSAGRPVLGVQRADPGDRRAGGAVCALLYVVGRSGAALFLVLSCLYGRNARRGAPSGPDLSAAGAGVGPGGYRRHLPHHQPRHFQGLAVHGGGHHRPRGRVARHAQAQRSDPLHADHRHPGHGRRRRHGGRAPAERFPVQGDVPGRGPGQHPDLGVEPGPAGAGDPGERLQRPVFAPLHPHDLLRSAADRAGPRPARAARLDAAPGRGAGGPVSAGRGLPGGHRRALSAQRGRDHARLRPALLQPGPVARLQSAAAAQRHRHGGRDRPLCRLRQGAERQSARRTLGHEAAQRRLSVRALPGHADGPVAVDRAPPGRAAPAAAAAADPADSPAFGGCGGGGRFRPHLARVPRTPGAQPGLRRPVAGGGSLRPGRGLAGQIPSPRRRHSDGRGGAGQLSDLRLAVGAGSGPDPAGGRGGDHGAAAAGPALAAQAAGRDPCARVREAPCALASSAGSRHRHLRRGGRGSDLLGRHGAASGRGGVALLRREGL